MNSRRRMSVLEFLRGPLAYVERPSDRERAEHLAARNSRPLTSAVHRMAAPPTSTTPPVSTARS